MSLSSFHYLTYKGHLPQLKYIQHMELELQFQLKQRHENRKQSFVQFPFGVIYSTVGYSWAQTNTSSTGKSQSH